MDEALFKSLTRHATRAPSGHNTQPWLFRPAVDGIEIHPDFSRALPVVDGDHHAIYISLGCAAENIVIAASNYGYRSEVSLSGSESGDFFLKVSVVPDEDLQPDLLFDYIDQRQSTRNAYAPNFVPEHDLEALQNSTKQEGIEALMLTTSDEIGILEPLIIEASNRQFKNKQFVKELVDWIRFSEKAAKERKDGLWSRSMGLPNMNRFIGNIVMKHFVSDKSEARRWQKLIRATAGFALFVADENDVDHWVRLGRSFQRFGLTATRLGISHAHVNMPCEELEVRQKLASQLSLGSRHPLLLIRFGYSEAMPYSLRRNPNDVILNTKESTHG